MKTIVSNFGTHCKINLFVLIIPSSVASKAEFNAIFEISNINYHVIHAILSGFWGHGNLQMASIASKVEFGLIFEISDFNYPYTHMDVAYIGILDGLWGCGDL